MGLIPYTFNIIINHRSCRVPYTGNFPWVRQGFSAFLRETRRLWTPRNVVLQGDNVAVQGTEVKKLPLGLRKMVVPAVKLHEHVQFLTSNSKLFCVKTQIISNNKDWAK